MGQEISSSRFSGEDFAAFRERLEAETRLLGEWIASGALKTDQAVAGLELEAWLVDNQFQPAPINADYLQALANPLVVPELARFNVELNSPPQPLGPETFQRQLEQLQSLWRECQTMAERQAAHLLMIGILPTVHQEDLCLANMSDLQRYRALNEQVFRLREGRPLQVDIAGPEHLQRSHADVMLEAAATSFQIHFKVDIGQAARAFNLSKIISAPMVALAANSPFLFGHALWEESRIPLFEQAVSVGGSDYSKRVTFGIRYAESSILEAFEANLERYPVLLPQLLDEPPERLPHLRLHNGTIWRWNRPLIGFSDDGSPHVRIEHRVAPSGPTPVDVIANMVFYFGLLSEWLADDSRLEQAIPFAQARDNFYAAARQGLAADIRWRDGRHGSIRELLLQELLPLTRRGLQRLQLPAAEIDHWLDILQQRVAQQATGARWQRRWVDRHGRDFAGLTAAYLERQESGIPVHRWSL